MKRFYTILVLALAVAVVTSTASAATFTQTLKKGSRGAEVIALQTILEQKGLLTMPAGVAKGYFGTLTVNAVKAYQASKGLSTVGQVGPQTRLALNAEGTTPTTGTTGTTVPTTTGISTPGVEGILTVSAGPITTSVVYEGQKDVPVLSARVQAQNSDMAVQRLTLDLGTDTKIYNKVFTTLYVKDGSTVVASVPLNSSTVVQSSDRYVVNATGFNIIVPKNGYKDITVTADLYPYISASNPNNRINNTIRLADRGVRAVDGAGIVQYGGDASITRTITISGNLTDSAIANISVDPSTVQKNLVPVTDTTNGQYLGLPVLTFAVNAQNDSVHFRNVKVDFSVATSGNSGVASVAYLYQGSTLVQSAAISSGSATFSNIINGTQGAMVGRDSTVPYTVKVDVTGVTAGSLTVTASLNTTSGTTVLNSQDGTVTINGGASGYEQKVAGAGPAFVLASAPTLTKAVTNQDQSGNSTTTYTGTFVMNVTAVGQDLAFGLAASSSKAFATSTTAVKIYKNGVAEVSNAAYNMTVNYSQPTGTVLANDTFTIARAQTIQVPVTYSFSVSNAGTNTYALQMAGITVNGTTQDFMSALTAWRTNVQ